MRDAALREQARHPDLPPADFHCWYVAHDEQQGENQSSRKNRLSPKKNPVRVPLAVVFQTCGFFGHADACRFCLPRIIQPAWWLTLSKPQGLDNRLGEFV